MEGNNADDAASNVSCQDRDGYPSQEKTPETEFPTTGQLASMDPAASPKKEASSLTSPFKDILGKSPKLRTPVKNQKLNPSKGIKRLFISSAKRKESKTSTLKRHKSSEFSSDDVDSKRKNVSNKSERGEVNLQDEDVVAQDDGEPLKTKATKGKLPVKKGKPVGHRVPSNEQVMKMFQDVLESAQHDTPGTSGAKKIDVAASLFEHLPTMTRARVREFLEKISMSSPVKVAREGPSIMDVEFNEEDDDDDEYNPEKDDEFPESDDESITSSKLSEFGSPYRDISSTPFMTPSRDRVAAVSQSTVTKEVTSDAVAESDLPNTSCTSVDNVLTIDTELTGEEHADGIALRTRSKQSLTSTSITEIESNFVAPDITTDMYDNYCDEPDYVQFLTALNKPTDDPMTDDDADANDPEYNYNCEIEKEQLDEEDFRWDKISKIPRREVDTLVEELYEYYKNDILPYQVVASASEVTGSRKMWPGGQDMPSSSQDNDHTVPQPVPIEAAGVSLPMPTTSSSWNYTGVSQPESSSTSDPLSEFKTPLLPAGLSPRPPSSPHLAHITSINSEPSQPEEPNAFTTCDKNSESNTDTYTFVTTEQRALIEDNIRKHIQLLLQSYMLCQNIPSLEVEATEAKCMILELNYFRESSCVSGASTFSVYNLDPAMEVLSAPEDAENDKLEDHVEGEAVCRLSQAQKLTVLNSPAFVYPHLLPRLMKPKRNERLYRKFVPSEDNLIAIGMEQFQKCKNVRSDELLHQLLMRGKSVHAIHNRIHFMSSRKTCDNAIKTVRKTGKLPESFPKPSIDYFYTVAPKYQMSNLLPAWCFNHLSVRKVQSVARTKLLLPKFIGQPSQQKDPGMCDLSTHVPQETPCSTQQTTPSQYKTPVCIPAAIQPVTFQTIPSLPIAALPRITGIYIQFSEGAGAGPQISQAISFPSLLPCMSAVQEPKSKVTRSRNQKRAKRTKIAPSNTSGVKKQRIQEPSVGEVAACNSSVQSLQNASPDLLTKTMLSCGIQECQVCPSPQSQLQYNHDHDQLNMSFASSTPVAQDKHPTVRNLAWEFDAADRQSLHSLPVTETQNTDKAYSDQPKSPCREVSACQSVVSQRETIVTPELGSCLASSVHHNEPHTHGELQKEEARISKASHKNSLPYSDSSSVSNQELLCDISKHPAASVGNDFHGSIDGTSQNLFSSETTVTPELGSCLASPVHHSEPHSHGELQKEEARSSNASHKNSRPYSDSSSVSSQDLLCDTSKHPAPSTRNAFQGGTDGTSQSIFSSDLPLASDMVNMETKKQAPAFGEENSSRELDRPIEVNRFTDLSSQRHLMVDITFQSQTERMAVVDIGLASHCTIQNDNGTCETIHGDQSAESGNDLSVQNDNNSLHNAVETCEVLQDDRAVQSDINLTAKDDKEALNNVIESDSMLTEDIILPVLTDDSSSSIDKTLICASDSTSDSVDSNKPDNSEQKSNTGEQQAQRKPKTIRQILEAAEKSKPCTATNTSVLTPDGDSVISDIVNENCDSAIRTSENTNFNQPMKGVTTTNDSSESSTCAQKENTSPLSECFSVTTPTASVALINLQSPVTVSHSNIENTRANQPTQGVTTTVDRSESSTCAQQENTSPLSQSCSVTTPTASVALINLQSPVTVSYSNSENTKANQPTQGVTTTSNSESSTCAEQENTSPLSECLSVTTSTSSVALINLQSPVTVSYSNSENTKANQPTQGVTTTSNSESSTCAQQENTSPLSECLSVTTSTSSVALINLQSPVTVSHSNIENTKANQPTQVVPTTIDRSESSTCAHQENTSPLSECFSVSVTTPTPSITLINLQSPVTVSHSSSENTKANQPTQGVTTTNDSSESSTCAQQENTSPLSECFIVTPASSVVLINLQSPVTVSHSSSENTKANQPTQGVTTTNDNSKSSTCARQANTSPLSQCCSVTTPTSSVALINMQSPVKSSHSNSNFKFPSPFKTPTKLHPLLPKTPSSAGSVSSPYIPLPKTSPRRKELNKHVRQILPKSFVFEMKSPSPTKTAAQVLKKKATLFCQSRSPVKLLPKPPQTSLSGPPGSKPPLTPTRMFTRSQKTKGKSTGKKSCQETAVSVVKDPQPVKEKAIVEPAVMETDDAVLSQEEEEEGFESDDQSQLDDLMAACTTIGYDPKKGNSGTDNDNKSKAQKKKDVCLSMLEPDIIDRDAKKDERDTAYAQHYFTRIKQVLGDDAERFKKFLTILHDMNRNHMSPVELYADMATLLSGHQDLVDDFAGFLLSFQAVECNCFVSYLEYEQILTFLRRLEIYCDSSNLTYQRTLKMMSRWLTMLNQEAQADTTPLKEKIAALLRHVPNIMDDLQSYFFGTALPDSHPDDFEEVNLEEEAMADVDEFEEITLPEAREDYNTKLCSCQCHQDQQDEKLRRRIKHCYSCSLKIFDGKPVLKTSRNEYRPITVLYPLEEKEKLVKAKKEAAQLALAKARAQRQLKKRKGKKKNVGSLKSKNSKNIPLKKKFKKKKRCKLQYNPAVVGNTGTSFTEAECESSDVKDGISTQKQDKPDLKSTCSKPGDDQDKTSSGKLTDITADISGSSSVVMTVLDAENTGTQLTVSTTKGSGIATVSQASEEATGISALENKLDSSSSATKEEDTSKGDAEPHFNAELHSSRPLPAAVSSATPFPGPSEPVPSSVTSVASIISLSNCLAGSDFQNDTLSVANKQRPYVSTHELNVSQAQVLPSLTGPVSCTSSTVTLSQINSFSTPRAPFSQISSDRLNMNNANASLNRAVVSSQNNTFVSFGLQPRFSSSPMMASPRIPVLVTLAPVQYLSPPKSIAGNEMNKPRQTNPQMAVVTTVFSPHQTQMAVVATSVFSPHQIKSSKSDGKLGSHGVGTGPSHSVIYSNPVCTQTLTSSSSSVSSSFLISAVSTDACRVAQADGCPASTVSDTSMDAKISTSTSSFSNFPSSFMHCDNQAVSISVSSSKKLDSAVDCQLSETISSLPSTPVKEKIPPAVLRAHLDNFSLGAFDTSIGFSQLQQFTESPSKYLTDSMSKFDLLALIESSNLGNKDFTLQSSFASSSSRTQAEPLLTFSGALEKLRADSEKPELTSSSTVHESQSVSVPVTMENLPATPGSTGPHEQPSFDHEMGDDRKVHSVQETEDDLQNLCPKLNPSHMLLDDEASNAFVLSVWTEEQDRTILDTVIAEGVTQEVMKKLHSEIPAKSVEEINSRAKLLLEMLEQMGDTESDTDTDTSHVDASEFPV